MSLPPTSFLNGTANMKDSKVEQVQIYTQNITRHPISWDPATQRPTQELVHSVHTALHFALDTCLDHPDERLSFDVVPLSSSPLSGEGEEGEKGKLVVPMVGDMKRRGVGSLGLSSSTTSTPTTTNSSPGTVSPLPTSPPKYLKEEMTAKLFLFSASPSATDGKKVFTKEWIDEALDALEKATGLREVDRFVLKLDGIDWEWDWEEGKRDLKECVVDWDNVLDVWEHISKNDNLHSLGVSDFAPGALRALIKRLPSKPSTSPTTNPDAPPETLRRPTTDQLNLATICVDCDMPPASITTLAKEEGVELVSHSDDLGTTKQFVNLLGEFEDRLPLPDEFVRKKNDDPDDALRLRWVLKYTIFIRDRGLVADKGYVFSASFP